MQVAKPKNAGRKVGRGNSKSWIASGGPMRSAIRKARNHGCNDRHAHTGGKGHRAH